MQQYSYTELTSVQSFNDLLQSSSQNTNCVFALFKHSTRCSISQMALNRMQKTNFFKEKNIPFYYLDLIRHRDVSDSIAEKLRVEHESPQLLLIKNGTCMASESHNGISESWLFANL
jgi:bacillithiol system protein YtxJ